MHCFHYSYWISVIIHCATPMVADCATERVVYSEYPLYYSNALTYLSSAGYCENLVQPNLQNEEVKRF